MTVAVAEPAVASRPAVRPRLESIDLLRGIVMVVMVLDHTRDFVHAGAIHFDPTDLSQTTTAVFLTRWVTHFCAPVFVLLAGVAAHLQTRRGTTRPALTQFLITRGLWLVFLELTVVRLGSFFTADYSFLGFLQVIWVLGMSMVVLSALIWLPRAAIAGVGLAMIVGHNAFDAVTVAPWMPGMPAPDVWQRLWMVLHVSGRLVPVAGASGPVVFVMYPLIPWVGVMAAGYAFGGIYDLDPARRRRVLTWTGLACIGGFLALRAGNIYGDPQPWQVQTTGIFTVLSFINTTKYPPSLLYLLMTLGPSLLALAWFEGRAVTGAIGRAFLMFGRVPLFFYLLQWPLAHALAMAVTVAAGKDARYLFLTPPDLYASAPPDAGFPLWVVYLCWATVVIALFFLCRWFVEVKRRNPSPLLRYL